MGRAAEAAVKAGMAPLAVQAAAAASFLAEGVPPEDIGAAAGLANPDGGGWDPRQLAHLADLVVSRLNDAAAAAATSPDAAFDEDDPADDAPGWWDPESLGALLCSLHRSDASRAGRSRGAFLDAADQATLAHVLVSDLAWRPRDAGDLLWCVHTAQEGGDDTSRPDTLITMERVEEAAEIALELARPRAIRGGGCGWTRDDASALLPRLLPAPDWDRGGLAGLTAVKGCALLAAALAAGGRAAVDEDPNPSDAYSDSDAPGGAWRPRGEYPRDDDEGPGWPASNVAAAVARMLDEGADEGAGEGAGEGTDEGADEGPEVSTMEGAEKMARLSLAEGDGSGSIADDFPLALSRTSYPRVSNSNAVGSVNRASRRGVAGRGGGGVVRREPPAIGPVPSPVNRIVGGWDPVSAAALAGELHGAFGWDVAPSAKIAAEVLGWEGGSPAAAADVVAALRSPGVGWSAANAAVAFAAVRDASGCGAGLGVGPGAADEDQWDAGGHLAPACDRLVETHGWSPDECVALLEELCVFDVDALADLVGGLRDWADAGVAALLAGLTRWRGRDRAEVAVVAKRLRETRGWNGGGVIGRTVGVVEGGIDALDDAGGGRRRARAPAGVFGEEGDGVHRWPPAPPDHAPGADDTPADGYSADAD